MSVPFVIQPGGGLCNYLRVTFSYVQLCKKTGQSLIVIWRPTGHCPGFFLDYFEPVPNTVFLRDNSANHKLDYGGCGPHSDYNPDHVDIYEDLKLLPEFKAEINTDVEKLGSFAAVHIRRTDHSNMAKSNNAYTDDQQFISFIMSHGSLNLYVATDNRETQDAFYTLFNERMKLVEFIKPNGALRQTGLKEAIRDLYMCVRANEFKGSGYSSFTDVILALRRVKK